MIKSSQSPSQNSTEAKKHPAKLERIFEILIYILSSAFVLLAIFVELYRISHWTLIPNKISYLIFILGAGYTGIFVKSPKYNLVMAAAASWVVSLSLKYGFFIEPGELDRHVKTWSNTVAIYAIIGWSCTFVYFISMSVNTVLNFIESLLSEKIRRKKKDSKHMLF